MANINLGFVTGPDSPSPFAPLDGLSGQVARQLAADQMAEQVAPIVTEAEQQRRRQAAEQAAKAAKAARRAEAAPKAASTPARVERAVPEPPSDPLMPTYHPDGSVTLSPELWGPTRRAVDIAVRQAEAAQRRSGQLPGQSFEMRPRR